MKTFASLFLILFLVSCNESAFTFIVGNPLLPTGPTVVDKLQYWSGNNYLVITNLDANNALGGIAGAFVWDD